MSGGDGGLLRQLRSTATTRSTTTNRTNEQQDHKDDHEHADARATASTRNTAKWSKHRNEMLVPPTRTANDTATERTSRRARAWHECESEPTSEYAREREASNEQQGATAEEEETHKHTHTETDTEERKNQKSPKIEVCPRDVLQYSSARWSFWLVLFSLLFSLLLPACCSLLAVGYVSLVRWLVARGLWLGGRLLVHDAQHITEYLVWITFSPSFG